MKATMITAALLTAALISKAQEKSLDGKWTRTEMKSTSGPQYSNGLPEAILFSSSKDTLFVERHILTEEGIYTSRDTLNAKGMLRKSISPGGRKMEQKGVWKIGGSFTQMGTYYSKEDTKKIESLNNEEFGITDNGNTLTLKRIFKNVLNANESFSVEGVYRKEME